MLNHLEGCFTQSQNLSDVIAQLFVLTDDKIESHKAVFVYRILELVAAIAKDNEFTLCKEKFTRDYGFRQAVIRIIERDRQKKEELHKAIPLALYVLEGSFYKEKSRQIIQTLDAVVKIPTNVNEKIFARTLPEAVSLCLGRCPEYNPFIKEGGSREVIMQNLTRVVCGDFDREHDAVVKSPDNSNTRLGLDLLEKIDAQECLDCFRKEVALPSRHSEHGL